jgi:hypothetical protein
MKKIVSFILIMTLISVFAGCSPSPSASTGVPGVNLDIGKGAASIGGVNASPTENIVTPQPSEVTVTAIPDGGLVDSYGKFATIEISSIKLMGAKITNTEDEVLNKCANTCMSIYSVGPYIAPILALSGGDNASYLQKNGYSDIKLSQNGSVFTVVYTANEAEYKVEAQYDKTTDSMTATVSDAAGGTQLFTFEYVLAGDAYAVQCFGADTSSGYNSITAFIDGVKVSAYGQVTTDSEPQSIYKNNKLTQDFVKSGSFYCVLSESSLSVTDNGVTKTY